MTRRKRKAPPPDDDGDAEITSTAGSGTRDHHTTPPADAQPETYRFSLVDHVQDNAPTGHASTLTELADRLRHHGDTYEEKSGPAFLPATFETGRRANEDVECVHWLALDIEDMAGTVEEILAPLTAYQRIVYSTWSHGAPEKWRDGEPRFRVLVPLERPVGPEAYRALWQHAYDLLDGAPDEGTGDPARLMFTPRRRNPDATIDPWLELHADGPALDPDALPTGDGERISVDQLVAQRMVRQGDEAPCDSPQSLDEAEWVEGALEHIDPDLGRDRWIAIMIALKSAFGEAAYELFDDWSSRADEKYEGPEHTRSQWDHCSHQHPDEVAGGGVTLGTIWHLAREHGWTPPADAYTSSVRQGAMYAPYEEVDPLTLDGARAKVKDGVQQAFDRGEGHYAIIGDPGTGKTTAVLGELADRYATGELDRIKYVTSTNDVLDEKRADLLTALQRDLGAGAYNEAVDEVAIQPKRTEHSCDRFDAYQEFEAAAEGAGQEFCQSCALHPDQMEDRDRQCGYILERRENQGADVQFTTAEMEKRTRGTELHEEDDERREVIRWTEILRTFLESDPDLGGDVPTFAGRLEMTARQCALTVEPDPEGREPLEVERGDEYTLDDGTPTPTAKGKRRIREWLAAAAPYPIQGDRDEVFGYYRREEADREFDVMVIDESVSDVLHETVTADAEDFQQWCQHGDLEGVEGWLESVITALDDDIHRPDRLADRLPSDLEAGDNETGASFVKDALDKTSDRAKVDAVEGAPDWRALEAIERASSNGWQRCYIRDGRLCIPRIHRLDLDRADLVLFLDATATPAEVQAVLGDHHETIRAAVEVPDSTDIIRVDWQHNNSPDGKARERLEGLLADKVRGDNHLLVTHKDLNPNAPEDERSPDVSDERRAQNEALVDVAEEALDLEGGDYATHFGGTETRGSNAYEDCDGATLASWYVPTAAIQQRAAVLEELTDRSFEQCEREARWQLEGAEIVQAAHRTRLLEGDTTIVYCDERDIPGLDPDEVISRPDLDRMAASTTGELRYWHGDHVATDLLRDLVDAAGGQWLADTLQHAPADGSRSRTSVTLHKGPTCKDTLVRDLDTTLDRLRTAFDNRWGKSIPTAAAAADLHVAEIRTSSGGGTRYVLGTAPLTPAAVDAAVAAADVDWRWYEYQGDRTWLDEQLGDLRRALEAVDEETFVDLPSNAAADRLAETDHLGSKGTAKRRISTAGGIDEVREWWRDIHQRAPTRVTPAPDYADRVEERAAIMEYHGGLDRTEAERRAREEVEPPAPRGDPDWRGTSFEPTTGGTVTPLEAGDPWGTLVPTSHETSGSSGNARASA